jgi:sugar O-acyltransferase (sialic acid O-acetyltransferase NeuD family)
MRTGQRGDHHDRTLFIAGAGWFAIEVAGWAEDAGWRIGGLIELLDQARVGSRHGGYPVVASDALTSESELVVAGGGDREAAWRLAEQQGCRAATVVHPTAHLAASAELAAGCIIGPAVIVGAQTQVHAHALLSRGALVGHHVTIEQFVRLMPGANVAGHVSVGARTTVGMNAAIADHIRVGHDAVVAAAAMVLRDVTPGSRVQGVPAREHRP